MRQTLLGQRDRFVERAARGGHVRRHPQLADQDEGTKLGVGLLGLLREAERVLGELQRLVRRGPSRDLRLRYTDRGESPVAADPGCDRRAARKALPRAIAVAVFRIEQSDVVE